MATGGIALNGSTQYLELNSRVVSAFPFTLVCWVAQNSAGSSQFVIAQQQSNGDRYAAGWLDGNGTTKYANLRNPGNSDNGTKTSAPHPSASLQIMVAVFASTTSRTMYFGDNTGATSTTSMTDDISNHDRITIGAWHYNSGAAGLFLNGVVAEAHIFNTALSSSDVTTLLTTTPESVSGWVDGWILDSASNLTSIGGTRTLTAVGTPTTASLTLPYSRTPPITATLTGALDTITGALVVGPAAITADLNGALDGIAGNLTVGGSTGRLTSQLPLRDAARVMLANRSDVAVHVLAKPGLGSVVLLSAQSIASGIWTAAGPFTPGQRYNVLYEVGGEPIGCEIITATAP